MKTYSIITIILASLTIGQQCIAEIFAISYTEQTSDSIVTTMLFDEKKHAIWVVDDVLNNSNNKRKVIPREKYLQLLKELLDSGIDEYPAREPMDALNNHLIAIKYKEKKTRVYQIPKASAPKAISIWVNSLKSL